MNTGERLVALSGLPSGSALAHFAAITQTGGTGPGSLLLVSKAAVQISYPEHRYHREAAQSFVLDTGNEASVTSGDKAAFVTTRREAVAVAAANEAVTISSKSAAAVVTLDQEEITINRRN